MQMDDYLSVYIDESTEHLQALNDYLMALEKNPEDVTIIQNIFRSAHTLKGMAAAMGFADQAALTHDMENLLDLLRNKKINVTDDLIELLFACLDSLENMVNDITAGGTGEADVRELVTRLQSIVPGDNSLTEQNETQSKEPDFTQMDEFQLSILQQSMESGYVAYYIKVTITPTCVLKAARAYMVFDQLEHHGEIIHAVPSVEEIEQEQFDEQFTLFYVSEAEANQLKQNILDISEIEDVHIQAIDAQAIEPLDRQHSVQQTKKMKPDHEPTTRKITQSTRTLRVDLERLDQLMNLFSELLIDRVRLEDLAKEIERSDLTETVEHMAQVSTDLQNIVLNLRMVPVESVFNRFPRMIRDVARSLDKKVDLIITGEDTELDRTVIDEIGDPLVHLLRNSLDHGLEHAHERAQAGKEQTGIIWLRAYQSGNEVFIEIEDNGRGIDRAKVLQIAMDHGLVSEDEAGNLSDEDVYQHLFSSGFSTAEQVTGLSGRGVGLDVVHSKITSLGGHISVHSTPGKGSKFTVRLPLTLSIISAMLIRINDERYAIPLTSILETSIVDRNKIHHVHGTQVLHYRETVIPVLYLKDVLACPEGEMRQDDDHAVIIHKGDKQAAIIVDAIIGQQEIVLKSLGNYLNNVFAISGATILGDGQVALILDPNSLIK